MGKPLFKASDGGRIEILWATEDITRSELQHGSATRVLIRFDVGPCLRRSGFAQAGRSLSNRFTHARKDRFLWNTWVNNQHFRTECPKGFSQHAKN
jgi:hypothetical protein